jgi:non-heme chloroperoxidase
VARIALLAPTLPFLLKTPDNPAGINNEGVLRAHSRAAAAQRPRWLVEKTPPFFAPDISPEMVQWGIQLGMRTSTHAAIETNISVTETDFRAELVRISVPTLILHGTKDVSCPPAITAEPTARLVHAAKLRLYDGAPHGLMLTHAARLNADLARWME